MDYLLIGIAAVIIIMALMYFRKLYITSKNNKSQKLQKQTGPSFVNCPLCGYPLLKGENLVSKVYRPMDVMINFVQSMDALIVIRFANQM